MERAQAARPDVRVSPATWRHPERRAERGLEPHQQDAVGWRHDEQPRGFAVDDPHAQSRTTESSGTLANDRQPAEAFARPGIYTMEQELDR